eukprot:TRINITY_DN4044_c1_g1_i1.p1 TRINITY_DN4044_c1_g1~~TRINITY_DN4044_c1_g1_i1.p1  ORF type:complete len:222 (+),score=5.84 TRINITY_DN4044_c1_g1_i1:928-1593(+)
MIMIDISLLQQQQQQYLLLFVGNLLRFFIKMFFRKVFYSRVVNNGKIFDFGEKIQLIKQLLHDIQLLSQNSCFSYIIAILKLIYSGTSINGALGTPKNFQAPQFPTYTHTVHICMHQQSLKKPVKKSISYSVYICMHKDFSVKQIYLKFQYISNNNYRNKPKFYHASTTDIKREKKEIAQALKDGMKQKVAVKTFNSSKGTISRIAQQFMNTKFFEVSCNV